MKYTRYNIYYYHYVSKCKKEKCIWKIFFKYTQIRQSNTNTNTNISSCGFSNTNTNTNTDICVFKYKYKYKYVFDPSPAEKCFFFSEKFRCICVIAFLNKTYSKVMLFLWLFYLSFSVYLEVAGNETGTSLTKIICISLYLLSIYCIPTKCL